MKNIALSTFVALLCMVALNACKQGGGSGEIDQTPNGFNYTYLKNEGGDSLKVGDVVFYNLTIKLDDSTLFEPQPDAEPQQYKMDDAAKRLSFKNPVLDAFSVASKGDEIEVYYPTDSIPAANRAQMQLDGGKTILYRINILDVMTPEAYDKYMEEKQLEWSAKEAEIASIVQTSLAEYKANTLKPLVDLGDGFKMHIYEEGDGALPTKGEMVNVDYYGVLMSDGSAFDNSFKSGRAFSFPLGAGQVIQGWDRGIAELKKGSKAALFIPYALAYGEAGRPPQIPAKSDLMFYVHLK